MSADRRQPPVLSVIAPARNEEANVAALVHEIRAAMDDRVLSYEVIIVDDGSTDGTGERLAALQAEHPDVLRTVRLASTPPGRGAGQSAAFHAGIRASGGEFIAMMDADLQNDPADLPAILQPLFAGEADFVQGDRSRARQDTLKRRASSLVGRVVRRLLLGDTIRDTGCSLRAMRREIALRLPLEFKGMHRFIPVTARQLGYRVIEMPVSHRPRIAGRTKYGVWNRALPGLTDCFAVRWMRHRRRPVDFVAVEPTSDHVAVVQVAKRTGPKRHREEVVS